MCQTNLQHRDIPALIIPPCGMQTGITPYAVKLATTIVEEFELDNLTKHRNSYFCMCRIAQGLTLFVDQML